MLTLLRSLPVIFVLQIQFPTKVCYFLCVLIIADIFVPGTPYNVPQQYTQNPSVLPYVPLLMVPQNDSMGPINYNAVPSVDRTGADLPHNGKKTFLKQECIPVGCVPSAAVAVSWGGVNLPRGVVCLGVVVVSAWEVYTPWKHMLADGNNPVFDVLQVKFEFVKSVELKVTASCRKLCVV